MPHICRAGENSSRHSVIRAGTAIRLRMGKPVWNVKCHLSLALHYWPQQRGCPRSGSSSKMLYSAQHHYIKCWSTCETHTCSHSQYGRMQHILVAENSVVSDTIISLGRVKTISKTKSPHHLTCYTAALWKRLCSCDAMLFFFLNQILSMQSKWGSVWNQHLGTMQWVNPD